MARRVPGNDAIPSEAWDRTHPDHDWWVNGRGWCYDEDCTSHTYGPPAPPEPDAEQLARRRYIDGSDKD